jgi:hypothetical protein
VFYHFRSRNKFQSLEGEKGARIGSEKKSDHMEDQFEEDGANPKIMSYNAWSLRLFHLQLQSQRCSRLGRFFKVGENILLSKCTRLQFTTLALKLSIVGLDPEFTTTTPAL